MKANALVPVPVRSLATPCNRGDTRRRTNVTVCLVDNVVCHRSALGWSPNVGRRTPQGRAALRRRGAQRHLADSRKRPDR